MEKAINTINEKMEAIALELSREYVKNVINDKKAEAMVNKYGHVGGQWSQNENFSVDETYFGENWNNHEKEKEEYINLKRLNSRYLIKVSELNTKLDTLAEILANVE